MIASKLFKGVLALLILTVASIALAQEPIPFAEYEVYDSVLKHIYDGESISVVVCESRTSTGEASGFLKRKLRGLKTETITDFNEHNQNRGIIEANFRAVKKAIILDKRGLDDALPMRHGSDPNGMDSSVWNDFAKRFGTGTVTSFSRVGFNKKSSQALVLIGRQYGWLAGAGYFYFMVKQGNEWIVKSEFMAWIS